MLQILGHSSPTPHNVNDCYENIVGMFREVAKLSALNVISV